MDTDPVTTQGTQPRQVTPADLNPGTAGWRVNVAVCAHNFFRMDQDPEIAAAIGKSAPSPTDPGGGAPRTLPFEPWSVADFSKYLQTLGLRGAGEAMSLHRILSSMERVGLLLPLGWDARMPIMGQQYITQGGASKGQLAGNLWLADIFGAELIIPSYNAMTMQLAGHDDDGNPVDSWGTGLIVDHHHVITNKHVVTGLAGISSGCPSTRHATTPTPNALSARVPPTRTPPSTSR